MTEPLIPNKTCADQKLGSLMVPDRSDLLSQPNTQHTTPAPYANMRIDQTHQGWKRPPTRDANTKPHGSYDSTSGHGPGRYLRGWHHVCCTPGGRAAEASGTVYRRGTAPAHH